MAFAIGSSAIPLHRFLLLDVVGAAARATVAVGGGYLAGRALNFVVADVKLVVLAIGGIVVLLVLLRILAGRLWGRLQSDA
jgi:membrane protein DedA with SNARE-associated domain